MTVRHNPHSLWILLVTMCLVVPFGFSQNLTVDGRIYTPVEGRQMANAYGYVATLRGIARLTTKKCSKWIPDYRLKYKFIYSLWVSRNRYYFEQNKKIYSDLVRLVSRSSGKPKKDIKLFYREMTKTAVKRFITILLRKELKQRNEFCHRYSARLAAGELDLTYYKKISEFIKKYKPL